MADDVTTKTIRYGYDEFTIHEAEANGAIDAGDVIVEESGGATVTRATAVDQHDRLLVAIDDRGRGMEVGDTYPTGDNVRYIAPSGGALNVLLEDGNTFDPSVEDRFVLSATAGKVRPFDGGAGDVDADVLFMAGKDGITIGTSGAPEPIPVEVA